MFDTLKLQRPPIVSLRINSISNGLSWDRLKPGIKHSSKYE